MRLKTVKNRLSHSVAPEDRRSGFREYAGLLVTLMELLPDRSISSTVRTDKVLHTCIPGLNEEIRP